MCKVQCLLNLSSIVLLAVPLVTAMRCMLVEMLQHILRCCMQKGLSSNLARAMSQAAWAQGYWVSDMTLQCFTGLHLKWSMALGVPLLFLVCLVIPLLPAMLLMQHRRHLDSPSTRLSLGFIYHPYK